MTKIVVVTTEGIVVEVAVISQILVVTMEVIATKVMLLYTLMSVMRSRRE